MSAAQLHVQVRASSRPGEFQVEAKFSPSQGAESRALRPQPGVFCLDTAGLQQEQPHPVSLGALLGKRLLADTGLLESFDGACAYAHLLGLPLRFLLELGDGAGLHSLPWESLRHPASDRPLVTDPRVVFSRYVPCSEAYSTGQRPLEYRRALVVGAPAGRAQQDGDPPAAGSPGELEVLLRAWLEAVPFELLPPDAATLDGLAAKLQDGYDFLILAAPAEVRDGKVGLLLGGGNGWVPGDELAQRLRLLGGRPRLVVLGSIGAAGMDGTADAALGASLAAAGVAAVIEIPGSLRAEAAAGFLRELFRRITQDGRPDGSASGPPGALIDTAVAGARAAIGNPEDAWKPVLYLSAADGRLSWYERYFTFRGRRYDTDQWPHWDIVAAAVRASGCTPILGPGLLEPLIGPWRQIARDLATLKQLPLAPHVREDMIQVAQYLTLLKSRGVLYESLAEGLNRGLDRRFGAGFEPPDPEKRRELQAAQLRLRRAASELRRRQAAAHPADRLAPEPHCLLAGLKFPVYVTTSSGYLLEDALQEAGRPWRSALCCWKPGLDAAAAQWPPEALAQDPQVSGELRQGLRDALVRAFPDQGSLRRMVDEHMNENLSRVAGEGNLDEVAFELVEWAVARGRLPELVRGAYRASPHRPDLQRIAAELGVQGADDSHALVYHLFGILDRPESIVLTQDDYFDYLLAAGTDRGSGGGGEPLLPVRLAERLANSALLFIGFQLTDWSFRVLFRSVIDQEGRKARDRYQHVAVQLDPGDTSFIDPIAARDYLDSIFQPSPDEVSIFWGLPEDFLGELQRRAG